MAEHRFTLANIWSSGVTSTHACAAAFIMVARLCGAIPAYSASLVGLLPFAGTLVASDRRLHIYSLDLYLQCKILARNLRLSAAI